MGSTLTQGQWSHLAVVFNGTQATFYVNGTVRSTPAIAASMVQRDTPLRLGADAQPGQYFRGRVTTSASTTAPSLRPRSRRT